MALVDSVLASQLKNIFSTMKAQLKGDDWLADELAKAIDQQIKTAAVNQGIPVTVATATGIGSTTGPGTLS
jgi:hypothetical protein